MLDFVGWFVFVVLFLSDFIMGVKMIKKLEEVIYKLYYFYFVVKRVEIEFFE